MIINLLPFIFYLILAIILLINILPLIFIKAPRTNTELSNFDVIIVLGNPANSDGTAGSTAKQRVLKAVELFKSGYANQIIFTGAAVYNQYVEAEVMANLANSLGVANDFICQEKQAKNTYQNAFYSLEVMKKENWRSAIVVTSPYHLKRTSYIFSYYSIEYLLIPSDYPDDFSVIKKVLFNQWENYLLTKLMICDRAKILAD
ncbi:MAG TPA: YdcF family protein [Leptolyngbyaceae cyanobacterium]